MYHSLTFYDSNFENKKNTFDDWHIVPSSRPVFSPPSVKKKVIEVPGADSSIDLTESLAGYPVYNNRTGSIEFIVLNDYNPWYKIYSEIMTYLHGQKKRVILEDDKEFYYEGRFYISEYKGYRSWSTITIEYELYPYKKSIYSSLEDWKWDTFNFETGIIMKKIYGNIKISSDLTVSDPYTVDLSYPDIGSEPIKPKFLVTRIKDGSTIPFVIVFTNERLGLNFSKNIYISEKNVTQTLEFDDVIFYGYGNELKIYSLPNYNATHVLSIDFTPGRL